MATESKFLPAERLLHSQVLEQARTFAQGALIAMLDTAPGMIALLNAERQIVFCNIACARAGGLSRKEEALGLRPGELLRCIHSTDMPGGCGTSASCVYCGLAQALVGAEKGKTSQECLLQCHGDSRDASTEYEVKVRPLPEIGHGWQCYSLKDVSGDKQREALERVFFHDILNLASALEGVSSVLAEEDMPVEERDDLTGKLFTAAHALVREIHSHRTLLAAEKGELAVKKDDCDSLQALQQAASACESFGFAQNITFSVSPESQSFVFKTDAALLGRILINMSKNALEASAPGAIVTASCIQFPAARIRFSVHNDSVMPDPVRAHVFQRSFTTKGTGRGLGTYSIKLLTETYLGGRAWFDSNPGDGTTFYAEFPA